ncbi:MAG: glycosyltransferase family 2 protein [Sphingobacteriales bacterium]|nr:MAG: glycosyltransferase family 2 protein [Sphingobacteriales bacterium]
MTPKVSILIPTYNYAHYIGEAIESALNQTYTNFELIIVDDQSKDNTDEVVSRYLKDTRVKYYKNKVNLGLAANFNEALKYANGEYIKYLLADDLFHPTLLEKMVPVMDQHPGVSLVTSKRDMFGSKNKSSELPLLYLQDGNTVIYASIKEKAGNWIGEPTTVMFRKSALKIGGFNTTYTCLVDWEMWLRILTVGDCYIIPETLSYFRVHDKQASKLIMNDYKYTFEDYDFYKSIKRDNPLRLDLKKLEIDNMVKKRAVFCSKAMYKLIPHLGAKKARENFMRAFRIAWNEGVMLSPLLQFLRPKKN